MTRERILPILLVKLRLMLRVGRHKAGGIIVVLSWLYLLGVAVALFGAGYWVGDHLSQAELSALASSGVASGAGLLLVIPIYMLWVVDLQTIFSAGGVSRYSDLASLQVLPLSFGQIFSIKLIERAAADVIGHLCLLPLVVGLACAYLGPALGLPLALFLYAVFQVSLSAVFLATSLGILHGLRASTARRLVEVLTIGSSVAMMALPPALMVTVQPQDVPYQLLLHPLADLMPLRWPAAALLFAGRDPARALAYLVAYTLGAVFLVLASRRFLERFRARGWAPPPTREAAPAAAPSGSRWTTGFIWKELLVLRRDPQVLTNAVFFPLSMLVMAVLTRWYSDMGHFQLQPLLMTATAMVYFAHINGTLCSVGGEGPGLRQLGTLPISPTRYLIEKALLWGTVVLLGVVVPGFLALVYVLLPPGQDLGQLIQAACWLTYMSYFSAFTAIGLSAHFAEPDAEHYMASVRPVARVLFLVVASGAAAAPMLPTWYDRFSVLMANACFALAFFQKALCRLRALDQPGEVEGPASLLADGLLLLFTFRFVGGILGPVAGMLVHNPSQVAVLTTLGAQAVVAGAVLWQFRPDDGWRQQLGLRLQAGPVLGGVVVAVALGQIARVYIDHYVPRKALAQEMVGLEGNWVALALVMTCLTAPVAEELLFRGMIHRGLSRRLGRSVLATLVSAGIFGLVHPGVSFPVVFLLGFATAAVYELTGCLPASMLLHVVYNTCVSWHRVGPLLGL